MSSPYDELLRSFYFRVTFDNEECEFQEVGGLNASIKTEAINEGGNNDYVLKLPVRVQYDNLVLKRGLLKGAPLITWVTNAISYFKFEPKDIKIELLNDAGV